MTKKQVWKYRCDFCRKTGLGAGHMANHEKRCTANPLRECRMHVHCEKPQASIPEMMLCLFSKAEDHGIAALREMADGCPACMLAAIRQSGICKWDGDPESPPVSLPFDYKKELAEFWASVNENEDRGARPAYSDFY